MAEEQKGLSEPQPEYGEKELFSLITRLGEMIIKNGGEIFRADGAMRYAAKAYGLQDFHSYVVSNGIFSSYCSRQGIYSAKIICVPFSPTLLNRLEALNQLSRRISDGLCGPEEADRELSRIGRLSAAGRGLQVLAAGIGAGSFSILFHGTFADGLCAFLAGLLLELFLLYGAPALHLPEIMLNILGAAVGASVCCLLFTLGFGDKLDLMIIGPVFVLTPGVPITNSIRNFIENDYLSGLLRMMDALLVAGSVAIGVGLSMQIWHFFTGGVL